MQQFTAAIAASSSCAFGLAAAVAVQQIAHRNLRSQLQLGRDRRARFRVVRGHHRHLRVAVVTRHVGLLPPSLVVSACSAVVRGANAWWLACFQICMGVCMDFRAKQLVQLADQNERAPFCAAFRVIPRPIQFPAQKCAHERAMSLSGVDTASVMPIEGLFTCEDPSAGPQAARSKRLERQTIPPNGGGIPFFSTHAGRPRDAASATIPPYLHPTTATASSNDNNIAAGSGKTATPAYTAVFEGFQCAPTSSCHLQLAQLQDEKEFLTKYVERILNQLRVVLQRHGELEKLKALTDPQGLAEQYERMAAETNPDNFEGEQGGESRLPYGKLDRLAPWLTSKEYTDPLLQAYDPKIYELERSVEENKKAMDRIVARAESLAKENTSLRQEMEATAEKEMLRMQHEPKDVQLANDDFIMMQENGEYLNEINERIDVLMSENNMLMEQVSLQDDELCAIRKELTDRDDQLQVMGQNFNQVTLVLQELRDSCESIRDEKVRCEQQLQQYAATMAQLESRKEALTQQSDMLRSERKHLENQMVEYESLLSTVKKNAERKGEIFSNRYQNVCARLRELNNVVEHKERAIGKLEEKNRTLQVDLESARQDCEGMLNVLNSMEKQLAQYCNREESVAEQTAEHLKIQGDTFGASKRRHEVELHTREEEVRFLNSEVAQLRVKLEFAVKNQKEAEKKLSDAIRRSKEASDVFESSHLEAEYLQKLRAKEEELGKLRNEYRERTQELNVGVFASRVHMQM
ncbi:hypothetical protein FI667_g6928, partial [Globisporangium splendens]